MPRTSALACCIALIAGGVAVASQMPSKPAQPSTAEAPKAINAMCPIGNEPIDGKTFAVVNGVTLGFCCPGCDSQFIAWPSERKAAFIEQARADQPDDHHGHDHGDDADHAQGDEMPLVFPYYLANCPIMSGRTMDPARGVVKEYEGREVRFCCQRCEGRFDSDPAATLAKMDELLIADQLPLYPLTDCLVMEGHEMGDDAVNMIYKNRLVRFCCEGCIAEFESDPETYLHKLDKAAADAQSESYPMTDCVVAQHAVADGEHPTEVVVGGRLIRLCCPDCMTELLRNPAEYVKALDDARAAAAR